MEDRLFGRCPCEISGSDRIAAACRRRRWTFLRSSCHDNAIQSRYGAPKWTSRGTPDDPIELVRFDNSFARLPERFHARLPPTPVAAPRLIHLNEVLAADLGFDPAKLATPEGIAFLAGNRLAAGTEPLASAYAGHQFGNFVPQLGDGRAILLGEIVDRAGVRRDIQLKGAGPTPFSRRGDGRAALGPVLREYLISEAMAALGVPTTRSLAAVTTGEFVLRDGAALPGAILTRVAREPYPRRNVSVFCGARRP